MYEFRQRYPSLSIELQLDDRVVNTIEEGIDVSIRIGWLDDSQMIARKLCDSPRILCASPAYIEQHGSPTTPTQLTEHECIIFTLLPTPHQWTFFRNKRRETIQIRGQILTNSAIAMRELVLKGTGIAPLSHFLVSTAIAAGQLEPILPDYDCGSAGVYAVYLGRRYKQAKVRLFIDFIDKRLKRML